MSEAHPSSELLGRLLDHIAHDLRGRSGVMLGALTEIELGGDPERIRTLVAIARRSAQKLLLMADDLRCAGQLHSGDARWDFEPRDLKQLVERAIERASVVEARRGIAVEQRLADVECLVSVDAEWVSIAVTELVVRAILAARTRVVIELEQGTANVVLTISDDGPPLPSPLPERFSASPRDYALGLTLSLARDVARAHGARFTTGEQGADRSTGGCIRFEFSRSSS